MNLTIEQMRKILDGAPDRTADVYCVGDWGIAYFSLEFGSVWCEEEKDWFDSDYETVDELGCDYKDVVLIKRPPRCSSRPRPHGLCK